MAAVRRALKAARESIANQDYKDALQHCKAALKEDRSCHEAYVYVGKAAFHLGEYDQAELAYHKATEIDDKAPPGWQGLAELYTQTGQWAKAAEAYQNLVDLAHRGDEALSGKLPALSRKLAEAYRESGSLEEAEEVLKELMRLHGGELSAEERLGVLSVLADIQMKEDIPEQEAKVQARIQRKIQEAGGDASKVNVDYEREQALAEAADEALELDSDHATATLKEIVLAVPPTSRYYKYHDAYLRRLRRAVQVAPPNSMDRHNRRVAVLEMCRAMMEGVCGDPAFPKSGCASGYAFETALRFLEIEEELAGGAAQTMPRSPSQEQFGTAMSLSRIGSAVMTPARSGAVTPSGYPTSPKHGSFFNQQLEQHLAQRLGGHSMGGLHHSSSSERLNNLVHHPMSTEFATIEKQQRQSLAQLCEISQLMASTHSNGLTPAQSVGQLLHGGSLSLTPTLSRTNSNEHFAGAVAMSPRMPPAPAVPSAPLLVRDTEAIAKRLAHAFPWNPTAQVQVAMALRRREAYLASGAATIRLTCGMGFGVSDLSCSDIAHHLAHDPVHARRRRKALIHTLASGLARGALSVAAMIGLAELRMEIGDCQGALDAAKMGIKFVYERSKIGKERARHAALMLNLLAAQAMSRCGQLEDAARIFYRLSQRVSEGEVVFGELVGLAPMSIRQEAIRGLAQVALAKGDRSQAQHHYEELVAKAMMGRGTAEHWAYAEYGWLLFEDGNADVARMHLETALDTLHRSGYLGVEQQAAEYHWKLGRVYWELGGEMRAEREYAQAQFLEAAAEDGPWQAPGFEWLGHWYDQVAHDEPRARKCYQRALALDPTLASAGDGLCRLLAATSSSALETRLCEEILDRAPDAHWAKARLAYIQLAQQKYTEAVASFQAAIRGLPDDAGLWEGMGAAYRALGRHNSALKSFMRAIELEPGRLYSVINTATLEYQAGAYAEAVVRYKHALTLDDSNRAIHSGLAEALLAAACMHARMGAFGASAIELQEAAEHATVATKGDSSNLVTAWKLLGDVYMQHNLITPSKAATKLTEAKRNLAANFTETAVSAAEFGVSAKVNAMQSARLAYAHALHLNPTSGPLWGDVACSYSQEAKLLQQQMATTTGQIASLNAFPTALVKGGVRLSPSSGWLWSVLGNVTDDPATAEYAWSRALQLDPRDTMTWVQLGRLYSRHGAAPQAQKCFEQARSIEPTLVAVWEAMGAAASSNSNTEAAARDMLDNYEHAVGLGGGLESWLGYATAAIQSGHAMAADVFGCATKSAEQQPLMAAAHNTLGLAYEARGQYSEAINAFKFALAVLEAQQQQSSSSSEGGGRCPVPCDIYLSGSDTAAGVPNPSTAVELNLARALCCAGRFAEALLMYNDVQQQGSMTNNAYAWISQGVAQHKTGNADGAVASLHQALRVAQDVKTQYHAIAAILQHHIDQKVLQPGFNLLLQTTADLAQDDGLHEPIMHLWLMLLAAAVIRRDAPLEQQIRTMVEQTAQRLPGLDQSMLKCRLSTLEAQKQAARGQHQAALHNLAHAVHVCPWDVGTRVQLASQALLVSPKYTQAAYRACPPGFQAPQTSHVTDPVAAQLQPPAHVPVSTDWMPGQPALAVYQAACITPTPAIVRTTGLVSTTAAAVADAAECEMVRLQQQLHADPDNGLLWYLLALVSLQRAIGTQQCRHFRSALACTKVALTHVRCLLDQQKKADDREARLTALKPQQQWLPPVLQLAAQQAGQDHSHQKQLQHMIVHLMVSVSECYLQSRLPGDLDHAHAAALDALSAATSWGTGASLAHCQVGRMLASEDMLVEAEVAYRQAVAGGNVCAALELAHLLQQQKRGAESAGVLHAVWSGTDDGQQAAAAAGSSSRGLDVPGGSVKSAASLQEGMVLASLGDFEGAETAALAALDMAEINRRIPVAAHLLQATIGLQQAAVATVEASKNVLLKARWNAAAAVTGATALPGTTGMAAAGIAAATLSQIEQERGKADKAYEALSMSMSAWAERPTPAAVHLQAGVLLGDRTECSKAIHLDPLCSAAWDKLGVLPAAES